MIYNGICMFLKSNIDILIPIMDKFLIAQLINITNNLEPLSYEQYLLYKISFTIFSAFCSMSN